MSGDFFENGIGDLFISNEQKKINASMLADAELQRKQSEALIAYMQNKKVGSSATSTADTSKQKYIILGGVALVMVFVIIMTT